MTTAEIIYNVILPTLAAALGGSSLLTFYLQERFKYQLNKEMVEHEANIRHQYETKIENLRSQLSQQNFRLSQIFGTTETVIANVYKMLLELKDASEGIAGADAVSKEQRFDVYLKKAKEFLKFYEPNKIYIPKNTAMKAKNLFHTLQDAVVQWHVAIQVSSSPMSEVAKNKDLFEKYLATTKEIPDLLNQIEIDFQTVLGFPMESK